MGRDAWINILIKQPIFARFNNIHVNNTENGESFLDNARLETVRYKEKI